MKERRQREKEGPEEDSRKWRNGRGKESERECSDGRGEEAGRNEERREKRGKYEKKDRKSSIANPHRKKENKKERL
jgi:hypothetical protein